MDIKNIIREEVNDFDWVDGIRDTVVWEDLRLGDMVELVAKGSVFWNGTNGVVVRVDDDSVSIDFFGDRRLLFDDTFDKGTDREYRFKLLNNMNESDDLGWMDDTKYDLHSGSWYIDVDGLTRQEMGEIQLYLFSIGIQWFVPTKNNQPLIPPGRARGYTITSDNDIQVIRYTSAYSHDSWESDLTYINGKEIINQH